MIRDLLLRDLSLWSCLWQSTTFLVLGIVAGRLLLRRPSRAYQVLLFAMVAAVLVPFLSAVVRHYDLGVFTAATPELQHEPMGELGVAIFDATDASTTKESRSAFSPEHLSLGPAMASAPGDDMTWGVFMLYAWIVATIALLARLAVTFLYGTHLVCHARRHGCEPMQKAADVAASRVGLLKGLQVRASDRIRSPVVWCWTRPPVLLVPSDYRDCRTDWAGVIAHELAHCKRWDHLTGLLAELAVSLLPWNPLMWLSRRQLIRLGEEACDDWVVATGHPSEDYAESLLRFRPQRQMAFVPAVVHSKKGVAARVRRILNDACGNPRTGAKWVLGVSVVVTCVAVGFAFAQTRPAEPIAQSANKVAANSENPQQPRYAARTFNSKIALDVFVRKTRESGYERIGQTPSVAPLEIPACLCWWVKPSEPVTDWDLLLREMSQSGVPGLRLEEATDSDLRRLADSTGLEYLDLSNAPVTDAGLAHLKGLATLQVLNLGATQVTDGGLAHLKGVVTLQGLNLTGTQITDAGLAHLKGLAALQNLGLDGTPITHAGLEHLKGLTRLRSVSLNRTKITDAGLEQIKGLTGLSDLALTGTKVTDGGLAYIRGLTGLKSLVLAGTQVTDAGLAHLKGLAALQDLNLGSTSITDTGLEHLKGLTKLEWLYLASTQVTNSGVQQLKQSLPKLTVERNPPQGLTRSADRAAPLPNEPAADSAELAPRRHVARSFNSKLAFEVWVYESVSQTTWRRIGYTPSAAPLKIPACMVWCVQPVTPVKDWDSVLKEMSASSVPGLRLAQDTTDSDLKHLAGFAQLEVLDLTNTQVTVAGLVHLEGLTGLWALYLQGTKIAGPGLEHLKGLTELQRLNLDRTPVTDAGLYYLKESRGLRQLSLQGTKITDQGLEHLKGLSELRQLGLQNTPLTDAGLAQLRALPNLRQLDADDTQITDAGLNDLKELKGLRYLSLSNTKITGAGLESLKDLSGLQILHVQNTQVTDAGLVYLEGLTELRQLDLVGTELTGPGLEHLKGLTRLSSINLSDTRVTDSGLAHLPSLPRLQRLSLPGTPITDAGLVHFKGLTGLQQLDLSGTEVTDAGVQQLKQSLPKLTVARGEGQLRFAARTFNSKLEFEVWVQQMFPPTEKKIGRTPSATPLKIPACSLWGVRISAPVKDWDLLRQELSQNEVPGLVLAAADSDLKQLPGLGNLRSLNLEESKITDAGLEYLEGMSQMEQLWLGHASITDAGLEHLKDMTGLQILLLESAPITDAGLKHIEGLAGLRILDLQGTRVTDRGMEYLKGMSGLRVLRLIDTQITDTGLEYLKGMNRLQFLFLRGTKITDAGMERINHLTRLQYLFLGDTQITDKGLEHLKDMTGLRGLDLQNTQITDKGMEYLKGMTRLQQFLILNGTKITDAGVEPIKGMTRLQMLGISGSQVTEAGVQQLKQSLPKLTIN